LNHLVTDDRDTEQLRANWHAVRERVARAAARAGRDPSGITIVAVTKGVPAARISAGIDLGVKHIGENRAQEVRDKEPLVDGDVSWHFIGQLQRNKVKYVLKTCCLLHSCDRLSLGEEIDRRARAAGLVVPILVQVNVSGEPSKIGAPPEALPELLRCLATLEGLRVQGLMTIAPPADDPEEARPVFARLREAAGEAARLDLPRVAMRHLSMGMTDDFEVAVEEGATLVRIGRAIFGARPE